MANLGGWHLLIVVAVIVLLFGAAKLPALAKSMGQSMKIFRTELRSEASPVEQTAEAAPERAA